MSKNNDEELEGARPDLQDLYPDLGEEKLQEAETNLRAYAELAVRVLTRLSDDPEAHERFEKLTPQQRSREVDEDHGCPPHRTTLV